MAGETKPHKPLILAPMILVGLIGLHLTTHLLFRVRHKEPNNSIKTIITIIAAGQDLQIKIKLKCTNNNSINNSNINKTNQLLILTIYCRIWEISTHRIHINSNNNSLHSSNKDKGVDFSQ